MPRVRASGELTIDPAPALGQAPTRRLRTDCQEPFGLPERPQENPMKMRALIPAVALYALFGAAALSAQDAVEVDYDRLLADVEESATLVNSELDELSTALEATINSQQEVDERFARIREMLDQVSTKLGEDSPNWQMVEQAIAQADTERQAMLDKYANTNDVDYQGLANDWATMKDRLVAVREGLLSERTDMEALKGELERSYEKVSAFIKIKRAEQAAKKLEEVRDRLAAMNQTMRTLVESTKTVQAGLPN